MISAYLSRYKHWAKTESVSTAASASLPGVQEHWDFSFRTAPDHLNYEHYTRTHTPSVFFHLFFLTQVNPAFVESQHRQHSYRLYYSVIIFISSHPLYVLPRISILLGTSKPMPMPTPTPASSCCFFRKPRERKRTLRHALCRFQLAVLAVAVRSGRSYHYHVRGDRTMHRLFRQ